MALISSFFGQFVFKQISGTNVCMSTKSKRKTIVYDLFFTRYLGSKKQSAIIAE